MEAIAVAEQIGGIADMPKKAKRKPATRGRTHTPYFFKARKPKKPKPRLAKRR